MDNPQSLISAYLDGDLTPEQLEALERWINASEDNAAEFVRRSFENQGVRTHLIAEQSAQLIFTEVEAEEDPDRADIMSEVVEAALAERRKHELADEASRQLAAQQQEDARNRRFELRRNVEPQPVNRVVVIPKALVWLGLAAVAAIVATLAIHFDQSATSTTSPPTGPTPLTQREDMPVLTHVAFIRDSVDARWSDRGASPNDYLASGVPVTLTEGLAEVVFGDGTAVIVQGPATFEPTGPNGMRLISGRMTARVPDTAQGFTVKTPSGLITDYGTEFGVVANLDGHILAQTFTGRIGFTPQGGGDEVHLLAGDAVVANTRGRIREVQPDELVFTRAKEFEAIRDTDVSQRARWVAARYRMLRDPSVVAFVPFVEPREDWPGGIGYRGLRVGTGAPSGAMPSRPLGARDFADAIEVAGDSGFGGALVAGSSDPVFIDLDTAPGGTFDAAGLLDENGLIGRPGTTLYISWRVQGDGGGLPQAAVVGFSLMWGDREVMQEPAFFGLTGDSTAWSVNLRRVLAGGEISQPSIPLESTDARPGMRADGLAHLWLVRIDFAEGDDRVRVYLDPDPDAAQLPEPNLLYTDCDVTFDRLRFTNYAGAVGWRLDEVLISTTPFLDSSGTVPGG